MARQVNLLRASAPSSTTHVQLGPLADLPGTWIGKGFNLVSLPDKQDNKPFRRPPTGIPAGAIANPNEVLTDAIKRQKIVKTVALTVNAAPVGGINGTPLAPPGSPNTVGSIANIPFVDANPNANGFSAIFWVETVQTRNGRQFLQLQYTQTVIFDFLGLKWPHISVATLVKR